MRLWHVVAHLGICTAVMSALATTPRGQNNPKPAKAADAHIGKAYQYLEQRRYADAAQEFSSALSVNSQLVQARYEMAICEFALGRIADARAQFLQVQKATSGSPQVTYYLGRVDLREGKYEQAAQELLKISSSPPYPDTTYYLGSAYFHQGNLTEAERWLQEAAKANPRDFRVADHLARLYQKEKQPAKAEMEYRLSTRLREYYNHAATQAVECDHALETESRDQAHSVCHRLFDSEDEDKLILLGMIYGRHGDFQDALPPLQAAVRIDPDSWAAEHNLGLTYFRLRRYSNAVVPLRQAVRLRPEYFGSSALLGATLYTLKQDQEAFRVLLYAHQLNPQDPDTAQLLFNETLVLARQRYLHEEYLDCLTFLHEASALRPDDERVHLQIDEVKRRAKRMKGAVTRGPNMRSHL